MVISQRLAKRLCQSCKKPEEISELKRKKVKDHLINIMDEKEIEQLVFQKGAGCEKCHGNGYK